MASRPETVGICHIELRYLYIYGFVAASLKLKLEIPSNAFFDFKVFPNARLNQSIKFHCFILFLRLEISANIHRLTLMRWRNDNLFDIRKTSHRES